MILFVLLSLIAISVVLAGWALSARRLERWRVTAPLFLVVAGAVVEYTTHGSLADTLNADIAEHVAEIILAVLLFVDATDVRGGFFGSYPRSAMRLLFIALPLSIALSMLLGLWLLPTTSWATVLVIACMVVPIDFAPAESIPRDQRIPDRVRDPLKVEAGYADGIVAPTFLFALALASENLQAKTPLHTLGLAVTEAVMAIVVGLCVGAGLAVAANFSERRGVMTEQSRRLILVAAPALSYTVSLWVEGNGFVAAFVCGVAFNLFRHSPDIRNELELLDDIGFLLTAAMWFVFGGVVLIAYWSADLSIGVVVFCVLALTVVRILPVLLAMLRSRLSWGERLLIGLLGARGTPSIVLGLLAFNVLDGGAEHAVLLTMVLVVLGSVVIHGVGAPLAAHAYARSRTKLSA